MSWKPKGGRVSLRQGLDREAIVRKLIDDDQITFHGRTGHVSVSTVYERIKKSNSSLNRKSKRLLEDSIERVITVISDAEAEGDGGRESALASDEDQEEKKNGTSERANRMNDSIVGLWSVPRAVASPRTGSAVMASSVHTRTESVMMVDTSTSNPPGNNNATTETRARGAGGEPPTKRRKDGRPPRSIDRSPPTHLSLADLGGVESVVHELTELIALPMLFPSIYSHSGIQPPRGVLLYGPPGCGKTMIANAFAAELGVSYIPISAPSIVSGMSGESEKKLREYFDEACRMAPCLLFIDEIDAITPKRESAQREMEKRIVAQMLTCMDDLALDKTDGKPVIVVAATNRPDSLDPALRRAGRFNKEISLSVPNEDGRVSILRALTRHLKLEGDVDFHVLAKMTPGYVGADLHDLVSTAGVAATTRMFDALKTGLGPSMETEAETNNVSVEVRLLRDLVQQSAQAPSAEDLARMAITQADLVEAVSKVQPSSKREGFATIPHTTWRDVGALHAVREELQMAIVEPIRRPERYAKVGIVAPTGVLLWGPPGCGKTLLAKAVANESKANFISVKGPELLNKYVGESERAVRQVFVRARSSVPCVIFFDELDAVVPRREDSSSEAAARVVNTLLTELDGLSDRTGIFVIAATNRPDIIDPAMLRPGRLGTLLFVDLPGPEERVEILRTLIRARTTADIAQVARRCQGYSGADLESLLRAAGVAALRRDAEVLEEVDFEEAMRKVTRSVSEDERERYRHLRGLWS
ncbi:MAG: Vacuolar protein sorting-associated protein 20 [Watsoniomyces obsoletus]|nr:MAG: Vacuolar protein sorting-associated protein 20 [Watsoniomyces obsoletus]